MEFGSIVCPTHTLLGLTTQEKRSNIVFMVKLLMNAAKHFEPKSLHPYTSCLLVYHKLALARSWLYNKLCTIVFNCQREFHAKNKVRKTPHSHVLRHSVLYFTCIDIHTHTHKHKHIYSPGSITQHFVAESLFTVTAGYFILQCPPTDDSRGLWPSVELSMKIKPCCFQTLMVYNCVWCCLPPTALPPYQLPQTQKHRSCLHMLTIEKLHTQLPVSHLQLCLEGVNWCHTGVTHPLILMGGNLETLQWVGNAWVCVCVCVVHSDFTKILWGRESEFQNEWMSNARGCMWLYDQVEVVSSPPSFTYSNIN